MSIVIINKIINRNYLFIIAFLYNNSVYININKVFNKLFKNYIANLSIVFENKFVKIKISLIVERALSRESIVKTRKIFILYIL